MYENIIMISLINNFINCTSVIYIKSNNINANGLILIPIFSKDKGSINNNINNPTTNPKMLASFNIITFNG